MHSLVMIMVLSLIYELWKKNITKVIFTSIKKKVWNYKNVVIEKNIQEKIVNGIIKIIQIFL